MLRDTTPRVIVYLYSVDSTSGDVSAPMQHREVAAEITQVQPPVVGRNVLERARRLVCWADPRSLDSLLILCGQNTWIQFQSLARVALVDIQLETKKEMARSRMIAVVRSTWPGDYTSLIPPMFRDFYFSNYSDYSSMIETIEDAWEELKGIEDESAFALAINKSGSPWRLYGPVLFRLRAANLEDDPLNIQMCLLPLQAVADMVDKHGALSRRRPAK